MYMKYLSKQIKIPALKLNFKLIVEEKDAEQLDIYIDLLISLWKQEGRGNDVIVLDHLSELPPSGEYNMSKDSNSTK